MVIFAVLLIYLIYSLFEIFDTFSEDCRECSFKKRYNSRWGVVIPYEKNIFCYINELNIKIDNLFNKKFRKNEKIN